jgi:hypothetical protein
MGFTVHTLLCWRSSSVASAWPHLWLHLLMLLLLLHAWRLLTILLDMLLLHCCHSHISSRRQPLDCSYISTSSARR